MTENRGDFNPLAVLTVVAGVMLGVTGVLAFELGIAPAWLVWLHQH
jgi:hypothetical protein